jgi:aminobenzoyl-glutamate transport protein
MMAGIAPELTQGAYRVGDSVTNPVTPFNPYVIIVLAVMQRYRGGAGLGTLFSLTLPYAVAFFVAWTGLLLVWVWLGVPLGPGAPLWYTP